MDFLMKLTRRGFLKSAIVTMLATVPGCSREGIEYDADITAVTGEDSFSQFLDVLFPFNKSGLGRYRRPLIGRLSNLGEKESKAVIRMYSEFKKEFINKHSTFKSFSIQKGETIVSEMLKGRSTSDNSERALDIIYEEISRLKDIGYGLWGRKFSYAGIMCAFWDNYDKPVIVK